MATQSANQIAPQTSGYTFWGTPLSNSVHVGVNACMTGKERGRERKGMRLFFVRLLIPVKKGEADRTRRIQEPSPELALDSREWGKNRDNTREWRKTSIARGMQCDSALEQ